MTAMDVRRTLSDNRGTTAPAVEQRRTIERIGEEAGPGRWFVRHWPKHRFHIGARSYGEVMTRCGLIFTVYDAKRRLSDEHREKICSSCWAMRAGAGS